MSNSPKCLQTKLPAVISGYVHLASLHTGRLCASVPADMSQKAECETFLSPYCYRRLYNQFHHHVSIFMYCWDNTLIITALHNSSPSPSREPVSPSCPKFRTSEITPLPADLLSHRAFSAVIPDSCRSCGAKIDLHPYVIGSAKQTLSYYSASLLSCCRCVTAAEILLSKHEMEKAPR